MANIIDNLRELAAPAIVSALSRRTGEAESAVSMGLSATIPAIASTIANRSDDPGFMQTIASLASKAAHDPLGALNSLPAGVDMATTTGGWLSTLFGDNLSDVTDSIARYAGIHGSSAASLLTVGAPLVLGYIGRLMRSENLSVNGVADLFRRHRAELASALPAGFDMPESLRRRYVSGRPVADEIASIGWSMPLVALLTVLGIGGLIWWANHSLRPAEVARVDVAEPLAKAVGTTGMMAGKFARTLPGNVVLVIPAAGSTEDRLSMYLAGARAGSTTIDFDRIAFDSGSARLTLESNEQIDNIATILQAYPSTSVTIAGHTDSVGSEAANRALSRARANAVAAKLTADGVPSDRVHAEGYGSQKPMGDNATEPGRAQNRRVELQLAVP